MIYNLKKITESLLDSVVEAGEIAKEISQRGVKITIKHDKSPVTDGDIEVDQILTSNIKKLTPDIPIISEETVDLRVENKWKTFWLIDPIDGTYDYINNRDEFTINAGLIINNKPEAGIIYAPAKKRLFYSYHQGKSFEISDNKKKILDCKKISKKGEIKAVSYSNELKPQIKDWHKKFNVTEHIKMKSSLKFCVIASGEYDLYIAEPRACEWDIAAGHAILCNAGGLITDFESQEILYGKKDFKNPSLILKRSNLL